MAKKQTKTYPVITKNGKQYYRARACDADAKDIFADAIAARTDRAMNEKIIEMPADIFCIHTQYIDGIRKDENDSGTAGWDDDTLGDRSPYMKRYFERFCTTDSYDLSGDTDLACRGVRQNRVCIAGLYQL